VNSNGGNGGGRTKAAGERPNSRAQGDASKSKRQIVGQYMIGKTIGEGTFGKVKLAVHIPTGEKVCALCPQLQNFANTRPKDYD